MGFEFGGESGWCRQYVRRMRFSFASFLVREVERSMFSGAMGIGNGTWEGAIIVERSIGFIGRIGVGGSK